MSVDFLHDSRCHCRVYDPVSHCKADERGTHYHDDRCDRRLVVLHAFCQQILCNHEYLETVRDADDRIRDHYGAGAALSECCCRVDLRENQWYSQLQGKVESTIMVIFIR